MPHFYRLRVAELRHETAAAVIVTFALAAEQTETFRYNQGQHLTLRRDFGGQELRRNYSICSSVKDNRLRVAIKHIPGGVFSGYANQELRVADELDVMPPSGRFFTQLDPSQARGYLAFAAGSGITPILSIIKTTLETEAASQFSLVYGNRSSASILFLEELGDLKNRYRERFRLIHVLSREAQDIDLFNGRIDATKVNALLDSVIAVDSLDECFICGPQAMLNAVSATLQSRGVEPERIHFELFSTAEQTTAKSQVASFSVEQAEHVSEVTVILDGKHSRFQLQRDGEAILDAALKIRPDMPYACKGGMCCTCRAKVIEGEVAMKFCYGLAQDEIAAGYVLSCQAHPVSDRVVLDYDQR